MYHSKLLSEVRMRKSNRSLILKLNVLITAIVLIVSTVLVTISYSSYSKSVYAPFYSRLDKAKRILSEIDMSRSFDHIYQCSQADGFAAFRAEALEQKPEDPDMDEWLKQFLVSSLNDELMQKSEYDARMEELTAEAERAGIAEENLEEWIRERDPAITSVLFDVNNEYFQSSYSLSSILEQSGCSHITVYAEDAGGYVQLIECFDTYSSFTHDDSLIWTFQKYGERYLNVEAIRAFREKQTDEAFRYDSEDGAELARIISFERDGRQFYIVFACGITEVLDGQRAFLFRSLALIGLMVVVAIAISLLILRRIATKPLRELTEAVGEFNVKEDGTGEERVIELDIKSRDEIGDLYRNFRAMQTRIIENTESLTRMTAEKERISTELDLATRIQEDMLPNVFPPFPDRKEFDIYASMDPARAVGGDFYDFFLIDDDHLALVMADVSGKGIPGALFMMISKIMVQNVAMTGLSPAKTLEAVNRQILVNNREEMFVTVWLGILEISSGRLTAANAGHEYPVLMQPGSGFSLFKDKHGFVIGAIEGMEYQDYELQLRPGAKLFVYTDGLPEAADREDRQFGIERMLIALNRGRNGTPEQILGCVREAVDAFVGEAEQFDDLTMLCLEYRGKEDTEHEGTDG